MTLTSKTHDNWQPLVRNNYWHGKLMGVQEFQREQRYLLALQRTISRLAIGSGVLCGLRVAQAGPTGLRVESGAAVDGEGRLILVQTPVDIDDITRWLCPVPTSGKPDPGSYQLCLLHHECPTDPAPALVSDCDTRIECKPGAIEERFRFEVRWRDEETCPELCVDCRALVEPGRDCACASDCVELAVIAWDGEAIVAVTMAGRAEVPSNRELYELLQCRTEQCDSTTVRGPRLVRMWPTSGSTLDREGSLSEWARWRLRPRIELEFDAPVNEDRIDDPGDWIRAWAVANDASSGGSIVCERLSLTYLEHVATGCCGRSGLVLRLDDRELARLSERFDDKVAVVVQARCNADTGPVGAGPVAFPAQLEHPGTTLTSEQLAALWAEDAMPEMTIDALRSGIAPTCFTDGFDGGRLHSVFFIDPVVTELRLTAVYPYNGARAHDGGAPSIQVSFARAIQVPNDNWILDAANPWLQAWFIADTGDVEKLTVAGASIVERPQIADVFDGEFDASLRDELAGTAEYRLSAPNAPAGRVLVVSRSPVGAVSIGSFAGTCVSRSQLAELWDKGAVGKPAELAARTRPSDRQLPRASDADGWIHWTFAWEKS
jgi:hypothetical protein